MMSFQTHNLVLWLALVHLASHADVALVLGREARSNHATRKGVWSPATANLFAWRLNHALPLVVAVADVVDRREEGSMHRPTACIVVLLNQIHQLATLGNSILLHLLDPITGVSCMTVGLLQVKRLGNRVVGMVALLLLSHVECPAVLPGHLVGCPHLLLLLLMMMMMIMMLMLLLMMMTMMAVVVRLSSMMILSRQTPHILQINGHRVGSLLLKMRLLFHDHPLGGEAVKPLRRGDAPLLRLILVGVPAELGHLHQELELAIHAETLMLVVGRVGGLRDSGVRMHGKLVTVVTND